MFLSTYTTLFFVLCYLKAGVFETARQKRQYKSDGDLILIGMFPITVSKKQNESVQATKCSSFKLGMKLAEAFRYAVNVVNNEDMLNGMKLGYEIKDTCSRIDKSVKIALDINDRVKNEEKNNGTAASVNKIIAVIGAGKSELSISVNNILSATGIPQVSYASTSQLLSNKHRFPTFSRTIPTDTVQAKVITQLLGKFDWTYITLVYSDDNYGRPLAQSLISYSEPKGICFANIFKLQRPSPSVLQNVVNEIKLQDKARVVVVFLNSIISEQLVKKARLGNVTKIWIFTATWYNSKNIFQENGNFLEGSIGVVNEIIAIPQIYTNISYGENIKSSKPGSVWNRWGTLSGSKTNVLRDSRSAQLTGMTKIPYVINSVFAVANAIKTFCIHKNLIIPTECKKVIKPCLITQYLRNISFKGVEKHYIYLNQNGDPIKNNIELYSVGSGNRTQHYRMGLYNGLNNTLAIFLKSFKWDKERTLPFSKCSVPCPKGYYTVTNVISKCCWQCILCPPGQFSNETDSPKCRFCPEGTKANRNKTDCEVILYKYLRWDDPWTIFILISTILSSLMALIFFVLFIKFSRTPVVRASDREFSLLILLSLMLGLMLPVMYPGKPTNFGCRFQEILPNITYSFTLSLLIAKINRTAIIFNLKRASAVQKLFVKRSMQVSLVLFLTSTQLIVCFLWLSSKAPYIKEKSDDDYRLISCHFNSVVYFLLSKFILILLSFICIGMALISRHIPCSYNNAFHILFALLIFKVTWLIGVVGRFYGNTGSIVDPLTITISYSFFLYLMFSPKIYILLLRKDLNTSRAFRERTWAFTLKNQTASLGSLQFSASTLEKPFVNNEHIISIDNTTKHNKAVQTDNF